MVLSQQDGLESHWQVWPVALVLAGIALLTVLWLQLRTRSSNNKRLPSLPYAGLLGNIDWLNGPNRHTLMLEASRVCGRMASARVATDYFTVVFDGKTAKKLLPYCESNKNMMYKQLIEDGLSFKPNLFGVLGGQPATSRRKAFRHGFSASSLRSRDKHVVTFTNELCALLQRKGQASEGQMGKVPVDLRDAFMRFTLSVIFKLTLDVDFGSLRNDPKANEIIKALDVVMGPMPLIIAGFPPLKYATWLPAIRELHKCCKYMIDYYTSVYEDFCERYQIADEQGKAELDATTMRDIMKFHQENPDASPYSELALFIGAGYETTAHSLVWILHDLMRHPTILEHLVDELDEAAARDGEEQYLMSSTVIPLLESCMKESLRLHPPALAAIRVVNAAEGVDVGNGVTVHQGAQIAFSIYAIHRSEQNWECPDEYKPERWTNSSNTHLTTEGAFFGCGESSDAITYLPFFTGSRNCIGVHLALMEIRTALKVMLRKLRFASVHDASKEDMGVCGITLRPVWAHMAYVTPRSI